MTFHWLLQNLGAVPLFDTAMVSQLANEKKSSVNTQLSRWVSAGRILRLRHGAYCFAPPYGRGKPSPPTVANSLYRPSYLTSQWALSFYGLIPERVSVYTSATQRTTKEFVNSLGTFHYSHVGRAYFFGFGPVTIDGYPVMLAEPEKALLDLWHLERKPWTLARLTEMRFQSMQVVDADRLESYAGRCNSPRLEAAARLWRQMASQEDAR